MKASRTPALATSGARLQALDAVRALAILLVIGHHAAQRFVVDPADPIAGVFKRGGWIGVDMFFALSGFLIATILIRDSNRGDISGFFVRRAYRILPLLLVAVIVYAVGSIATGFESELLPRLWISALMLTGWAIPWLGVDGIPYTITWSLSVEEFAYVVLGLSAWRSHGALRAALAIFLVVALLTRFLVVGGQFFPLDRLYFFVPARLDAIAFGALGAFGAFAWLGRLRGGAWATGLVTVALVIAFSNLRIDGLFLPLAGYALFGLACAAWVATLAHTGAGTGAAWVAPLAAFGKVSYFLYLFHLFFIEAVSRLSVLLGWGVPGFWTGMLLSASACYLAAWISWQVFEYPLIRRAAARRVATQVRSAMP